MPPTIVGTARLAIGIYSFIAVIQAVRGWIEGNAAAMKRPRAIMAGQVAYTLGILACCAMLTPCGVAGWAVAVAAIFFAPICAIAAILIFIGVLL